MNVENFNTAFACIPTTGSFTKPKEQLQHQLQTKQLKNMQKVTKISYCLALSGMSRKFGKVSARTLASKSANDDVFGIVDVFARLATLLDG